MIGNLLLAVSIACVSSCGLILNHKDVIQFDGYVNEIYNPLFDSNVYRIGGTSTFGMGGSLADTYDYNYELNDGVHAHQGTLNYHSLNTSLAIHQLYTDEVENWQYSDDFLFGACVSHYLYSDSPDCDYKFCFFYSDEVVQYNNNNYNVEGLYVELSIVNGTSSYSDENLLYINGGEQIGTISPLLIDGVYTYRFFLDSPYDLGNFVSYDDVSSHVRIFDITLSGNVRTTSGWGFRISYYAVTGLKSGYFVGYQNGYQNGNQNGYRNGYTEGFNFGSSSSTNITNLFGVIADTPIKFLHNMFNFELFGMNVAIIILSCLTAVVVFGIIKRVWK